MVPIVCTYFPILEKTERLFVDYWILVAGSRRIFFFCGSRGVEGLLWKLKHIRVVGSVNGGAIKIFFLTRVRILPCWPPHHQCTNPRKPTDLLIQGMGGYERGVGQGEEKRKCREENNDANSRQNNSVLTVTDRSSSNERCWGWEERWKHPPPFPAPTTLSQQSAKRDREICQKPVVFNSWRGCLAPRASMSRGNPVTAGPAVVAPVAWQQPRH